MFSSPVAIKIAALLLLGFLKLVAGLSPMFFAEMLRNYGERRIKVATSLALCFGGGVLLASCMLHMIPKVRDSLILIDWKSSFPLAEFIVCCGFFAVFLVEEILRSITRETNFRSVEAEMRINGRVAPLPTEVAKTNFEVPEKTHHVLILSALSLHSALEGLALGLQPTSESVWMVFVAILIHAVIVLFSMGLKLVVDGSSELHIVLYMTISALSSPLGGGIGLVATTDDEKTHAGTVVTLQGLTAGAVLFVTFFEVLEKERRSGGFIRLFCVILGFSIIAGLQLLGMLHYKFY